MKATIEQLNALSDYEINCAVAEKLGYEISNKINKPFFNDAGNHLLLSKKGEFPVYRNFLIPEDYMSIAIEHGIDIFINCENRGLKDNQVQCCYEGGFTTSYYPKAQTGRAVCIAFLLMNQEPV